MKNITFLLFFLIYSNSISAQYTAIPDLVFENYLENNGMGDGVPNNGLVLTANINTVTTLDLPSFIGLTDLTGIEDFTVLEFLDFSYNTVTGIDLSHNTNLSILGCAYNNLTSLDLSNNTNLTWIVCMGNFLTSLLLNSSYIHTIECFENQLTSLDVTQSTALTYLDCHTNQITNLDLNQNINLTDLIAWDNQLSSIDISHNISLTYINVGHNNLSNLDTSNNIQLSTIACINNNLSSLTLTANINLESFIGHSNPLLISFDIRNGNNSLINYFDASLSNLDCIFVDDASASFLGDWIIDSTTTFVNNEVECEALNIDFFDRNSFLIFPNPAKENITLLIESEADFMLINSIGKTIKTGKLKEGNNKIIISNLSNGLYFIRVFSENGELTKKIIKE